MIQTDGHIYTIFVCIFASHDLHAARRNAQSQVTKTGNATKDPTCVRLVERVELVLNIAS